MQKNLMTYSYQPLKYCYTDDTGNNYCTRDFVNYVNGDRRLARLIFDACEGKSMEDTIEDLIADGRLGRCPDCQKVYLAKKHRTCPFCKRIMVKNEFLSLDPSLANKTD